MYAGGWKNDELKGKNKENKGVFVFGSSFSKMNKGAKIKKIRGSSFSGLSFRVLVFGS